MPFQKIQPQKLAEAVDHQIEELILQGILRPGARLPAERDLAERLGVSRPSLREAIASLQRKGLLESKAGSGIFVTEVLGSAFSAALVTLFAGHDRAVLDYVSFRRDMEGLAAERAALDGSDTDLQVIDAIFKKMEIAHTNDQDARAAELDAEFHLSIMEASHNVVMLHMMRSMFDLLQQGVFYNRRTMFQHGTMSDTMLEQHRSINHALQSRDAQAARAACEAHMEYVSSCLLSQKRRDENESIAQLRLSNEVSDLPG
ncbi:FadR/GntR family transcriptional regulator [Halocynthiibacter namhaensis]|uniref:FadR/GntR family transcriptional regulator n=1 Tax=Halocynthiibacter namhaensis TaxID=1290553 RepID=UPI000578E8BC|nr:FCD domain-containing protein [Halocynthiibacter namhaensis]